MMGAMELRATARPAAVLAVLLALGGCTGADPAPHPASSGHGSPGADVLAPADPGGDDGADPSPGPPDAEVVTLRSGTVAFDVSQPAPAQQAPPADARAEVGPAVDGAAVLTVALDNGPATFALTTPGTLATNPDGTVTVLDTAGTPVGGLSAPVPADGGAGTAPVGSPPPRASFAVTGPTRAELAVEDGSQAQGAGTPADEDRRPVVTTTLGTVALAGATWGEREGGRSLAVDPTAWARTAGVAGQDVLWPQLVAAEPEADAPGMHDQLLCHALGAPDKSTWNLEPWRPDVGLVAVLAARCNPT
jgi:hypothetical protein